MTNDVRLFPTSANTPGSPVPWTALAPDGSAIATTGSLTNGLQEAINFATANGFPLLVEGDGVPSSGAAANFIAAQSGITIPAVQQWNAKFVDVNLTFSSSVTSFGLLFDSAMMLDFDFQGQIVYQGVRSAVAFLPAIPVPVDHIVAMTDSHVRISNICNGGVPSVANVEFFPANGSILNCDFDFIELLGQGQADFGLVVNNPGAGDVFEQNRLTMDHVHQALYAGIQIGTSTTRAGNLKENIWKIGGIRPSGATAVGFNTFGSFDRIEIGAVNSEEGRLQNGIVFQPTSVKNTGIVGHVEGQSGAAMLDNNAPSNSGVVVN